ncbi:unnamed protein product [Brugia timori]|uniref:Uncharacterized protein n=1 Tax=Brugia timori TaxID=42155 RepID=A0A0R3QJX3_9BILA|nr:unnamed protein product [Brugia timori]
MRQSSIFNFPHENHKFLLALFETKKRNHIVNGILLS